MLLAAFLLSAAAPSLVPLDASADGSRAFIDAVDVVLALDLAVPSTSFVAQAEPDAPERKGRRPSSESASFGGGGAPALEAAGSSSTPQGRTFGIGLQLGYPTALTVKYMLRPDQGLVGGIGGFSGFAYDVGAFSLHVDYVYHPHVLTRGDTFVVTWYVGGGASVMVFGNARQRTFLPGVNYYYYPTSTWLAARVPLGVTLSMAAQPFEIYLEATPSLLVFPGVTFGLGAAIGARFYL